MKFIFIIYFKINVFEFIAHSSRTINARIYILNQSTYLYNVSDWKHLSMFFERLNYVI